MDVSALVTRLDAVVGIANAITAAPGGFEVPVDTGAELFGLLDSLVSNRVYPVTMKDRRGTPSIVYTLVGVDSREIDGFKITQTDRYVLELRAASYATLRTLINDTITTLRTSAYSIQPVDMLTAFDEDTKEFNAEIEIEFTYPVTSGGGPSGAFSSELPLVIVYPISRSARESDGDNYVTQRVDNLYAVVAMTTGDMNALLNLIRGSLLGFQQTANHQAMEYVSGANLGGVGGLKLWREVYTDWIAIQEQ